MDTYQIEKKDLNLTQKINNIMSKSTVKNVLFA